MSKPLKIGVSLHLGGVGPPCRAKKTLQCRRFLRDVTHLAERPWGGKDALRVPKSSLRTGKTLLRGSVIPVFSSPPVTSASPWEGSPSAGTSLPSHLSVD